MRKSTSDYSTLATLQYIIAMQHSTVSQLQEKEPVITIERVYDHTRPAYVTRREYRTMGAPPGSQWVRCTPDFDGDEKEESDTTGGFYYPPRYGKTYDQLVMEYLAKQGITAEEYERQQWNVSSVECDG